MGIGKVIDERGVGEGRMENGKECYCFLHGNEEWEMGRKVNSMHEHWGSCR